MSQLRRTVAGAVALALALGLAPAAHAADPVPVAPAATAAASERTADLAVLVDTIRSNRRAFAAANLDLSAEEGAKFWPIYERYAGEIAKNGDRLVALIEEYEKSYPELADAKALALIEQYLEIEAERVEVRRAYLPEFAKAVPGRTVARFYQLENKMDAVIRYELAASIPVAPAADAAR
jgi:hypothetical protein